MSKSHKNILFTLNLPEARLKYPGYLLVWLLQLDQIEIGKISRPFPEVIPVNLKNNMNIDIAHEYKITYPTTVKPLGIHACVYFN